jgi:hypothetical protein
MRIKSAHLLTLPLLAGLIVPLAAQQAPANAAQKPRPEDTEVWEPVPKVVAPGTSTWTAPADAIILFDGKNLDEWVATKDKSPAKWTVGDGVMTVNKPAGNIETKRSFRNYQPAPARVAATAACSWRPPAPATRATSSRSWTATRTRPT